MIHHFLINPAAGKTFDTDSFADNIVVACEKEGVEYKIYYTTAPRDATHYVFKVLKEHPEQKHRFYACGGDGTLGETINGGVGNEMAEFAVIPIGTGNDFCRNFSNTENFKDISRQINGSPFTIDVLKVNDTSSVNMINIGFDCDVVVEMDKLRRNPCVPNKLTYIAGLLKVLCRKMGFYAKITFDNGEVINRKLLLMAIANGSFCGGGFRSSPLALLNDGVFDAAIIKKISRITFFRLVPSYKKGTYLDKKLAKKCVDYRKARHMSIEFGEPRNICVDGELIRSDRADISICPNAVAFSIPFGSAPLDCKNPNRDTQKVLTEETAN